MIPSQHLKLKKYVPLPAPSTYTRKRLDFLKVLYFFPGWFFSCLSGAKLTGQKFYPWRHDNWPIGQWVIFHAAPDTAYVNQFFPAWIYNVIQIRSGETSRPLDSVARSVAARPHALKLVSLTFRTYERSTCCKSRKRCILRYASCLEDASSTMLSLC